MKKLNLNKLRKKKEPKIIIPNANVWNIVTAIILFFCAVWLLNGTAGWLNGSTMVNWYGMSPVLADTIMKGPDILFFATYLALGVSVILLAIVIWCVYRYFIDEMEGYTALLIVMICAIAAIWAFPFIHVFTDLFATAVQIADGEAVARDTRAFDVFQLGIDILPLLVKSAVCCLVLWINRRVRILT